MEPISRNKKLSILVLSILGVITIGLFGTGTLSLSDLRSDVLGNTCSEQGQTKKFPQYNQYLVKISDAERVIFTTSGEVAVINQKISTEKLIIERQQKQIDIKNAKIKTIDTYLSKNCKKNEGTVAETCKDKKQQKINLSQDISITQNTIKLSKNSINQFEEQINTRKKIIDKQVKNISRYTAFINNYETCSRQLQSPPIVRSPLMSGEALISGEMLISGEVCLSSNVLISGEVSIPGTVNSPVYRLAVTEESSSTVEIDEITYYLSSIDSTTLDISDWFIAEEHTSDILYQCSYADPNKTQLRCLPGTKSFVNSGTKNLILYARHKATAGIGSFKINSAHIAYNGNKADVTNYTTPIEIKYGEKKFCETEKSGIIILFPNGGEVFHPGQNLGVQTKTSDNRSHSISYYLIPEKGTPIVTNGALLFDKNAGGYHWGGMQSSIDAPFGMVIPQELPLGAYKLRVYIGKYDKALGSPTPITAWSSDMSDSYFKVISSQICPQFMPPSGGWCNGGPTIPGGKDKNGCELPPTCQPKPIIETYKGNSWNCYNGTQGTSNVCQTLDESRADAERMCQGKCNMESGKCGVNGIRTGIECTISQPINGVCGTSNNQCISGLFMDRPDTATQYLWQCSGVNGGSIASCSLNNTVENGSLYISASVGNDAVNDADIFINDVSYGKTYKTVSLAPGKYTVVVLKPGYTKWIEVIEVTSKNTSYAFTKLTPLETMTCPTYPLLSEGWCRGKLLPMPKNSQGCELPPVCIL